MKLYLSLLGVFLLAPLVSLAQQNGIEPGSTERAFSASTLADARLGYRATYGLHPKDCDPVGGRWVCSEFDVSDATPLSQPLVSPAGVSVVEACTAYGVTLRDAQTDFSTQCPWRVRETCNPLTSGNWACSTASIASTINAVATPDIFSEEAISPPPPVIVHTADNAVCTAYAQTLDDAQSEFSAECPWRIRQTCDPTSVGGWACSTASIDTSTNALSILIEPITTADTSTPGIQANGSSTVSGTGVMNNSYQSGDLLVIAHDSGPDTDDMQAIVANRMIMDAYPAVSYLLVGATQGHSWTNPTAGSESHTQSLFPDWINAKASTSGTTSFDGTSVIKVAEVIEQTLNSGGTVHIAEGGPSDFTAEVIRLLQSRGVQASNLKRIRVVQHSAGSGAWNEDQTSGTNMALVKSAATWVPIANGNVGGNATADFQEPASSSMCQRFMKSVSSTRYASQWAWAYSTIDDTRKCDQSDSVELLHILNDTGTRTFDQFTSRYL
jgi:hypothetical protein